MIRRVRDVRTSQTYLSNVNESPGQSTSACALSLPTSIHTGLANGIIVCHTVTLVRPESFSRLEMMCVRAWNESLDRTGTMTVTDAHHGRLVVITIARS